MREIKFKMWLPLSKKMTYSNTLKELVNDIVNPRETTIIYLQYTGLKDRTGKEIYEGDIVQYQNYLTRELIVSEVYYKEIASAFGVRNNEPRNNILCELPVEFEIIGTIYENPELMNEDVPASASASTGVRGVEG